MRRWRTKRCAQVGAALAATVGLLAGPAGAQPRPEAGTVTTYVVPSPYGDPPNCSIPNMTASPSGDAIYFSNGGRSDVIRMTTADRQGRGAGQFSFYSFPDRPYSTNPRQREVHVHDLAFGPNGNLFVTNPHRNPGPTGVASGVSELTQALQFLRTVDVPNQPEVGNQSFLGGITAGPGGMYVVSSEFTGDEEITLIRPDGTTRTYVITPENQPGVSLGGPLVAANGFIYAAAQRAVIQQTPTGPMQRTTGTGVIVRLDPNTGAVTFLDEHPGWVPGRMIVGPDGAIWYVETERIAAPTATNPFATTTGDEGRIARLDPATGQVQHFTLPPGTSPQGLTFGGDGRIWYTSSANPQGARSYIGALDPNTGQVTEYAAPAGATRLGDIVTGQAGDVYFSYRTADGRCAIGRIEVCSGNAGRGQGNGRAPCAPGRVRQAQGEIGQGSQDNPGQDNPGQDNPGQGNQGQDNPGQGNQGQGNPGQGNPGQGQGRGRR